MLDPPIERVEIPYKGSTIVGWLRRPRNVMRPPVAVVLPGLDACKEELHAWAEAFVDRDLAALTLDGPGQGETSFHLPVTHEWGHVLGAVIDVLERRPDVDGARVGVVGQSLGALYAPLAAAGEPRLRACIANCGPFDWGTVLPRMPKVSQEVFRVRSHSNSIDECYERGKRLTLEGRSQNIECPLLVIFGADDRLISPTEGERLAKTTSGPSELVVYPEGNHVCFNISYKFRPLTGDWMAKTLHACNEHRHFKSKIFALSRQALPIPRGWNSVAFPQGWHALGSAPANLQRRSLDREWLEDVERAVPRAFPAQTQDQSWSQEVCESNVPKFASKAADAVSFYWRRPTMRSYMCRREDVSPDIRTPGR